MYDIVCLFVCVLFCWDFVSILIYVYIYSKVRFLLLSVVYVVQGSSVLIVSV